MASTSPGVIKNRGPSLPPAITRVAAALGVRTAAGSGVPCGMAGRKKNGNRSLLGGLKISLGSKAASKKQTKPDVEQKEVSDGLGTAQRPIPCDWDGWWVLLSTMRVGNLDDPEVDLARGPHSWTSVMCRCSWISLMGRRL